MSRRPEVQGRGPPRRHPFGRSAGRGEHREATCLLRAPHAKRRERRRLDRLAPPRHRPTHTKHASRIRAVTKRQAVPTTTMAASGLPSPQFRSSVPTRAAEARWGVREVRRTSRPAYQTFLEVEPLRVVAYPQPLRARTRLSTTASSRGAGAVGVPAGHAVPHRGGSRPGKDSTSQPCGNPHSSTGADAGTRR